MLPLQQPLGHDAASQMHRPVVALHAWPEAHAPQVAPAVPHERVDSEAYGSQVPVAPPLQQPFGQVVASHAQRPVVPSQRPFAHGAHAAPPAPQSAGDWDDDGTHVLPLQHPVGHDVASHTHCPFVLPHS